MQCSRCHRVVADSCAVCPACGNPLAAMVDSYAQTAFAPAVPSPRPVEMIQTGSKGGTLLSATVSSPPTMPSDAPPGPHYVVTPAPQPPQYAPTMHSPHPHAPPPPAMAPYTPPPMGYGAPMMIMPPQAQMQGTPGLAVASLVCGLLGWIPLWIGFMLCLLAIIFAAIVLTQTRPGQNGRGLAITGLVLGLVLLFPAACGL